MQENQPPKRIESLSTVRVRNDGDAFIPEPSETFVETPEIADVCERSMAYLAAGYPVHFAGPSGMGKTTLAFHIASKLGRPAVLIHGNHEFGTSDLVGSNTGYRKSKVVDNYIHTVVKTSEEMKQFWIDNRLAKACREGYTLIYDEFNRSKPEANNVLLSVLEEGILNVPDPSGRGYVAVHPNFRAIFTSNPAEYAGTHQTQDALLDRLLTVRLKPHGRDAEVSIAVERSGVSRSDAEKLVDLVRHVRSLDPASHWPSVRSTITLSRIMGQRQTPLRGDDPFFLAVCEDVFLSVAMGNTEVEEGLRREVHQAIHKFIG